MNYTITMIHKDGQKDDSPTYRYDRYVPYEGNKDTAYFSDLFECWAHFEANADVRIEESDFMTFWFANSRVRLNQTDEDDDDVVIEPLFPSHWKAE